MKEKPLYWFVYLFVFVLIFLEFFHPLAAFQQDLGRHLKMGEIILTCHCVPGVNLFSYTYPYFPFINTHWLSEVVFFVITQKAGIPGLLVAASLVSASAFCLLLCAVPKRNVLGTFIAVFLYSGILLERTDLRPEIFSFFFVSLFIAILYRNRKHATTWLFLLPIIEMLWVNMHIYFIIGPLVIGLFLLESMITTHKHADKRLVFVLILTSGATLLNPNGLTGALSPFTVFHNYGYTIEENQSLFFLLNYGFRQFSYLFFITTSVLLFFFLGVYRNKTKPLDWLMSITFTALALSAIRNFPLFVFATFPVFASLVPALSLKTKKATLLAIAGGGVLICLSVFLFISQNSIGFGIHKGAEKGADFVLKNNLQGRIFNNFDIGSYLDYRFYPQKKVFVDGRPEAYPAEFFQKIYIPMQEDPKIFSQLDTTYHFTTIFFSITDQTPWAKEFLASIMQNQDWKPVYLDSYSIILLKNTPQNQEIIKKYLITPDNFSLASFSGTPKDLLRLAYFFDLVGWKTKSIQTIETVLVQNPQNCTALGILSQNPDTSGLYIQRYQKFCQ